MPRCSVLKSGKYFTIIEYTANFRSVAIDKKHWYGGYNYAPRESAMAVATLSSLRSAQRLISKLIEAGACNPLRNLPQCSISPDGGSGFQVTQEIQTDSSNDPIRGLSAEEAIKTQSEMAKAYACVAEPQAIVCKLKKELGGLIHRRQTYNLYMGPVSYVSYDNEIDAKEAMTALIKGKACASSIGEVATPEQDNPNSDVNATESDGLATSGV